MAKKSKKVVKKKSRGKRERNIKKKRSVNSEKSDKNKKEIKESPRKIEFKIIKRMSENLTEERISDRRSENIQGQIEQNVLKNSEDSQLRGKILYGERQKEYSSNQNYINTDRVKDINYIQRDGTIPIILTRDVLMSEENPLRLVERFSFPKNMSDIMFNDITVLDRETRSMEYSNTTDYRNRNRFEKIDRQNRDRLRRELF